MEFIRFQIRLDDKNGLIYQWDIDDNGPIHVEENLSEKHEDESADYAVVGRNRQRREDERRRNKEADSTNNWNNIF